MQTSIDFEAHYYVNYVILGVIGQFVIYLTKFYIVFVFKNSFMWQHAYALCLINDPSYNF